MTKLYNCSAIVNRILSSTFLTEHDVVDNEQLLN